MWTQTTSIWVYPFLFHHIQQKQTIFLFWTFMYKKYLTMHGKSLQDSFRIVWAHRHGIDKFHLFIWITIIHKSKWNVQEICCKVNKRIVEKYYLFHSDGLLFQSGIILLVRLTKVFVKSAYMSDGFEFSRQKETNVIF